jgi:cytochrome c oxidase cbb3-type subunit 3
MARSRRLAYAVFAGALLLAACDSMEDYFVKRTPGEKLYRKLCAECHGLDGAGNTPRGMGNPNNDLIDEFWKYGGDAGSMENIIRQGVFGEMPAHDELTDQEVRQIVDHVLKLRGETR